MQSDDDFQDKALLIIKKLKEYPLLESLYYHMEKYLTSKDIGVGKRISYEYQEHKKYLKQVKLKTYSQRFMDIYNIYYIKDKEDEDEHENDIRNYFVSNNNRRKSF